MCQSEKLAALLEEKQTLLLQREGRLRILVIESSTKDAEIRRLTEAYNRKDNELANHLEQVIKIFFKLI